MKGQAKIVDDPDGQDPEATPSVEQTTTEQAPETDRAKPKDRSVEKLSSTMRRIRDDEEQSLKAWLDTIGTQGAFKVQLRRAEPDTVRDPRTNALVKCKGYLGTFDHTIDEGYIAREFGGGTFQLRVTRPDASGSFVYERGHHRTIEIAGDPRLDRLPSNAPAPTTPTQSESAPVIQHALDMMERMVSKQAAHEPRGIDPTVGLLLEQLRAQIGAGEAERKELRREIAEFRNQKPPEDPFKDKLLASLVDGESGRILSIRAQHESELRTSKEGHLQEIRLIEDRHDRAIKQMQQTHELSLANMKASYEREIAAMNALHQVTSTATTTTSNVTVTTLNADIKRLERENDLLRAENKDLRERKDKPLLEQLKDMKILREALSDGEEKDGASTVEQVITALPAVVDGIGNIVQMRAQAQQQAGQPAQQAQQAAVQAKPRIVRNPQTGQRFVQAGGKVLPVQPKPKMITTEAGQQIEVPKIEASSLALLITMLEAAFAGDQDPDIVAQTGKAQIPPDILAWIRQHHTEQVSGVDLFMSKVAKLPGTSPLASQAGRTWLRRVGAALIGE
jgi:hypothetical protein